MGLKRILARVAAEVFQRSVARSRVMARLLFRVRFQPLGREDRYFDLTTPVLARKAMELMGPQSRVVDLGTGPVAVLGLAFWKEKGCSVVSCDIDPTLVALAQANVSWNEAPIRVVKSNFFEAIDEPFDIVTFNAPYVSSETASARNLSHERKSQWDGGVDGTRVIAAFLDQLMALPHPVIAYLGINGLHLSRDSIVPLLAARPRLELREISRPTLMPVDVYVVACRGVAEHRS